MDLARHCLSLQPRADSGDWSPVRSIGSVSGRGVWRILPLEQRLWAMGQPSASAQHVPGRVPVWYSLPHSPSAGSPGTRFLSEKPPSQAPSHPWWSSALNPSLLHLCFVLESFQIETNIPSSSSQAGVRLPSPAPPPSQVWLPPGSGQWAGKGWVRPGQTSRTERTSLFFFSCLLPSSRSFCLYCGNFFLFFTFSIPRRPWT